MSSIGKDFKNLKKISKSVFTPDLRESAGSQFSPTCLLLGLS